MPTKTSPYNVADKVAGAAAKGVAGLNPVSVGLQAVEMVGKGITAAKEAKSQGATGGQAALEGVLGTFGLQDLYTPKGIKERQASEETFAEATSNVNDQLAKNLAAQKSQTMENLPPPVTMKPFKALSPYTASYSAYNASAKQANTEEKFKEISGSNSALESNAFIGALKNAQENNETTFKVGDKTYNVK